MKKRYVSVITLVSLIACVKTTQDPGQTGSPIIAPIVTPSGTATPVPTSTPVGSLTPGQQAGTAALVGCTLNIQLGTLSGINPYQPRGDVIATCPGAAVVSVSPMNGAPIGPVKWRNITGNKVLSLYQWFTESGVYTYSFTVTHNAAQWTRIIQFEIGNRIPLNASAPFRSANNMTCNTAQVPQCIYPTNLVGIANLAWSGGSPKCRIQRPRTTLVLSAPNSPIGVNLWKFYYAKNTDPYTPACVSNDTVDTAVMVAGVPACKFAVDPVALLPGRIPSAVNTGDQHYFQYDADIAAGPGKTTITCPVGSIPVFVGNPASVSGAHKCEIWSTPPNSSRTLEVSGSTVYLSAAVSGAPYCPPGMLREGVTTGRCIIGNFPSWSPAIFTDSTGKKSVLVNPSSVSCEADL